MQIQLIVSLIFLLQIHLLYFVGGWILSSAILLRAWLDMVWRHSNCGIATEIHVAEAVLRAKLLYGLESAQLIPSVLKRLETFQLKVLRKILKLDTTYVNRENTNETVFRQANEKLAEEGGRKKTVTTFIEAYKRQKRKRACNIIRNPGSPIHKVSFRGDNLGKWIHRNRRVGRPRMNWTEETVKEIWDYIKQDSDRYKYTAFNQDNTEAINLIKQYAA